MLDFIKGEVVELNPASVVVEAGGLGYIAQISLYTYTALNGKPEAKVYVYEVIREDAHQLFGFIDKRERELFLLLISVSGVGANTARMILSSLSPGELESTISSGNSNMLKAVKGIGAKTAERIIIDLKDKVKLTGSVDATVPQVSANDVVSGEAAAALVMLGFNQIASQKVISRIVKDNPGISVEQLIKSALKML
ncbi:MAG: Holliday junction branch migration protein RuvA [Dysgonamonadaceae bacterium]|jgi:Holliday junction DNA helicase RuvA|nr:Holliday junction branch migration protein RuvA [Dysgonamonadaceae bacterium]